MPPAVSEKSTSTQISPPIGEEGIGTVAGISSGPLPGVSSGPPPGVGLDPASISSTAGVGKLPGISPGPLPLPGVGGASVAPAGVSSAAGVIVEVTGG